jgi:hypothetical protein
VKELEKWVGGGLSHFERVQIIGARLAGESITKTATLLDVSKATVSKVMLVCRSQEDNISKEEQWPIIKINRKRSLYIGKDCFEKS